MRFYEHSRSIRPRAFVVKPYSAKRALWLLLGLLCLSLGTIGLFLPLLPTTSFMLVAAFAFARSSPRLHNWLVNHRVFGPMINHWQKHGAVSKRAKRASLISMAIIFAFSCLLQFPAVILAVQGIVLVLVSLFLWTRPEPPQ